MSVVWEGEKSHWIVQPFRDEAREETDSRFLRRRPVSSGCSLVVVDACVMREERVVSGSMTVTEARSRMGSGRDVSWCRDDIVSAAVTALRMLDV